jgi:putative ATP-dependent endonuclease of OLD family
MLGKYISYKTEIPDYIMDAVFFAKETYSPNIIADIIDYRIKKYFDDDSTLDFTSCRAELLKYRNGEIKLADLNFDFNLIIPDDQILTLIDKLR